MAEEYDVIVVGGGPAGEHAAGRCRDHGLRTVLVEQELVGGECSYWACMPSKTLLRPGQVLAMARNVPGAKEVVTGPLDVQAALARRDWMTADWQDSGQVEWLTKEGIALVRGHGRLSGVRSVSVEDADGHMEALHAAKAVIIATGSSAAVPPIDGLSKIRTWDNRGGTAAKSVPRRLLVLGGGPVGCELAQAWWRLGSEEVTLIEAGERLLAREEPFVGEELAAALSGEGISVRTGTKVVAVSRPSDDAPVTVTLEDGGTVTGDEILVAVGRRPRSDDLGFEALGVSVKGPIEVDDAMHVRGIDGDWLYAIGDVNGRALFTHMGKYHARLAVDNILGTPATDLADGFGVPRVVFTDPQVAAVGITEAEAHEAGRAVRSVRSSVADVPAAEIAGERIAGGCQLVIDTTREVVVGAAFVGPEVADLLHSATMAIVGEVPLTTLRHVVAAFPTFSEVWLALIGRYDAAMREASGS